MNKIILAVGLAVVAVAFSQPTPPPEINRSWVVTQELQVPAVVVEEPESQELSPVVTDVGGCANGNCSTTTRNRGFRLFRR